MYARMGFFFDHIYAFEKTQQNSTKVYELVPPEWMVSYHWINIGVNSSPDSKLNPLYSILTKYKPDDFVVVKLDIDFAPIEIPLAYQLLNDERFHSLVDVFYFEHHVHMQELAPNWKTSMNGTVADSLTLFRRMRERGIAAHYWP